MRYVFVALVLLLFVSSSAFSQSPAAIAEEANPSTQYVQDNSPAAGLWRQIVAAKKANDVELHRSLVEQYRSQFPHKVSISDDAIEKPHAAAFSHQSGSHSPEWGLDDALVHAGPIGTPLVGGASERPVQIEADTLGNLYAAVLSQGQDTIFVYKSTDFGITWSQINFFHWPGGSRKWQGFDFFVADTANGEFKIGMVATATAGSNYDGQAWWISINDDGSGFHPVQIQPRPAGRGFINPAIISDAYHWSPGITYWYVAYQAVDSASGVGDAAIASLSTNWGDMWQVDSARSGFNDFDLDIDFNFVADTIHVLLTNDISPTNPNLRVRSTALSDFATSSGWSQANVAGTADPEHSGCLTSNRQTNELAVTYTKEESGIENIYYTYNPTGKTGIGFWTLDNVLSAKSNNESRSRIHCQEEQGAYRVAYVSSGAGTDTVIYSGSFTITGLTQHQVVNENRNASTSTAPDVVGFHSTATGVFDGGVIFAGFGPTNAYFDASLLNLAPEIAVSPAAITDTVTVNDSMDVAIQVSNVAAAGTATLNWQASIQSTAMASVSVIGGNGDKNDKVIAVGTPIPIDQLQSLPELKRQISMASSKNDAADKGMPFKKNSISGLQRIENVLGEEVFGSNTNAFGPSGTRGRGNMFHCTSSTTLIEHRLYLNITIATDMQFLVYEGTTSGGTYNLISVSDIASAGPGEGWYSSGAINVPLVAGNYYMIYPQWTEPATYYNEQSISPYPIPASFGELIAGIGWHAVPTYSVPPPATQSGAGHVGDPVAYYQTIVTADAVQFMTLLDPTSGSLSPGENQDLNVRIYGLDVADTTYTANIEITSNDQNNPVVTIPVNIYVSDVVGISDLDQIPRTFAVSQNYPNPFNPSTTISYQLPQASRVTIDIYNLLGQKVRTLINENMEPGYHQTTWNGLNDSGVQVGSGVYFYRFEAGDFARVKKMMFLK